MNVGGDVRLFVAVYPPPAVRDHLCGVVGRMAIGQPMPPGRSVRLVPPQQWHITLAFIGEVSAERCAAATDAVAAAAADYVAAGAPDATGAARGAAGAGSSVVPGGPPVVRLGGGSRFGRSRLNPVCVGVVGDVEGLHRVASAVRTRLRRSRVSFDAKPLRPHLTLARPGDRLPRETIDSDLELLAGYEGPAWTIHEVHLVRSQLGPRPVYTTLGAWRLDAGRPGHSPAG